MVRITERNQALATRLTDKQREELERPTAATGTWNSLRRASCLDQTREFHDAVDLPVETSIVVNPSVSLRELRLRLILEEFLETVKAMGFELMIANEEWTRPLDNNESIKIVHVEGSKYDIVETADGLKDLDVVVNGAMLSLGIPSYEVGFEVFCSNMSKLDEEGKPIVNQCQYNGQLTSPCNEDPCIFLKGQDHCCNTTHYQRPDLPFGKVLKPDSYVKANIARTLINAADMYGTKEI